jgi:hypothetical protein
MKYALWWCSYNNMLLSNWFFAHCDRVHQAIPDVGLLLNDLNTIHQLEPDLSWQCQSSEHGRRLG